jgi:hypothetical protein
MATLQEGAHFLSGAAGKARRKEAEGRMLPTSSLDLPPIYMPAPTTKQLKKAAKAAARATPAPVITLPAGSPGGLLAPPAAPGASADAAPAEGEGESGGDLLGGISDFFGSIPSNYLYIGLAVAAYMMLKKR